HPTRRHDAFRPPGAAANGTAARDPRPAGDGPALRGRLVAATHRGAPGPLPPDRPQRPARLPPPRRPGALPGQARPGAGRRPPRPGHLPAEGTAGPGPHLDLRPVGRGPPAARRRPQQTPSAALPATTTRRVPTHS